MPRIYTLDQLAMRIHEREVQRATKALRKRPTPYGHPDHH